MKHVVVPEVATDEMLKAMDAYVDSECGRFPSDEIYEAVIAAAPDTGMIAVDKVKFEAFKTGVVKALTAFKVARFDTQDEWRIADTELGNLIQALKDIAGDKDETKHI